MLSTVYIVQGAETSCEGEGQFLSRFDWSVNKYSEKGVPMLTTNVIVCIPHSMRGSFEVRSSATHIQEMPFPQFSDYEIGSRKVVYSLFPNI